LGPAEVMCRKRSLNGAGSKRLNPRKKKGLDVSAHKGGRGAPVGRQGVKTDQLMGHFLPCLLLRRFKTEPSGAKKKKKKSDRKSNNFGRVGGWIRGKKVLVAAKRPSSGS